MGGRIISVMLRPGVPVLRMNVLQKLELKNIDVYIINIQLDTEVE